MYSKNDLYEEPPRTKYDEPVILCNEMPYIMNTYNESDDIPVLVIKREMRRSLNDFITQFFARYDKISRLKFSCIGEESVDTSMYEGSSGCVFGLFRYVQLLRNDVSRHNSLKDLLD